VFNLFKNSFYKVLFAITTFVLTLYPLEVVFAEKPIVNDISYFSAANSSITGSAISKQQIVEKHMNILHDIDMSHANEGWVNIKYEIENDKRHKVIIQKDDIKYTYDLISSKNSENFPLQMGKGEYSICIYENVELNKYRLLSRINTLVSNENLHTAFLASVQTVRWERSMPAIKKAKELVNDADTTLDMIAAVYNHILDELSYDYKKMSEINDIYIPEINEIYKSKTGICYDFASLFAGMLRSTGIPAKLVKGYADNVDGYHSWNEVYIEENDEWITIDISFDAQMKKAGKTYKMIKDSNDGYNKLKEY
jgi:transglutaminase/protease-like cytokinesis protein 3